MEIPLNLALSLDISSSRTDTPPQWDQIQIVSPGKVKPVELWRANAHVFGVAAVLKRGLSGTGFTGLMTPPRFPQSGKYLDNRGCVESGSSRPR